MKKLIALMLSILMVCSLAACASKQDSASASTETASTEASGEEKTLTMATNVAFPPYEFYENEQPAGIDVDIATAICEKLGYKLDIMDIEFGAILGAVSSGKADFTMAGLTVTDERKEKVDFAKPYMKVALGVVSPENAEITDVSQLKGKTLIIAKGTTAESYFEKNEPDVKLQKYDQYADAYNALLDGRGDAFSTDNTEVLAWAKTNKGFKVGITKLGDEDTIAPAVQKGNKELLNWINDEIKSLGEESFFHKDYEETLVDTYGLDYEDELVVEGGETNT